MSHSFNFGNSGNESTFNPLHLDSPVARERFSRFSRLTESFNVSRIGGHSMLGTSQASLLNESSITALNQTGTDFGNVSDISSSINLNLNTTLQLPTENAATNGVEDSDTDDMARLAIFESFFELNQRLAKSNETFDLLQQFDQTCDENLLVSKEMLDSKVRPDSETTYLNKFSSLIRLERNTWRLLRALYSDRHLNQAGGEKLNISGEIESMEVEEDMRLRLSDSELVERAMERNHMLREMQIVIDWLESVYDEETLDNVEFYSDGPFYWENTLHSLKVGAKNKGTPLALGKGRQYCSQMDPDASIRTGMPLHDLDKEDENRLFHYLYRLIRAGEMQKGKEICERMGYYWLSAALDGWLLHHDPNYNTETSEEEIDLSDPTVPNPQFIGGSPRSLATTVGSMASTAAVKHLQPIVGNPYRDLWKHTAWKCSKMEGTNLYERAIFAVFSGNRSILMPLCTKWMDKLWAYFKCSLDVHLENLLIDSNIPKPDQLPRNNIELPDAYWDNKLSAEEIFNELSSQASSSLSGIRSALEEEYHQTVEQFLILGKTDQLIDHLYEWSKTIAANREARSKQAAAATASKANSSFSLFGSVSTTAPGANKAKEEEMAKVVEPNLLRFFAHLVIALRNLGLIVDEKQGDLSVEILETYIGFLIEFKLIELVAFYSLYLPEHRQVKMFANLLEGIDNEADRRVCIVVAKQSKLNLSAILTLVVENIRTGNYGYQTKPLNMEQQEKNSLVNKVQLTSTVTEEDLRKIAALDWFLMVDDSPMYMELLWQGNAMLRSFLLERKLDQAKETFAKIPSDIVDLAYQEWKRAHHGPAQNSVIGSLDIDNVVREFFCYRTLFEANESFQKWHHYLYNSKPREPTKPKALTRLSDRVAYEQAVKQFEQEMSVWQQQISNQASLTSEKLMAFLCFPEGIWVNVDDFRPMLERAEDEAAVEEDGASSVIGPGGDGPAGLSATDIEEVADDTLDINSDIEIHSDDLRRSGDNMVLKMQQERKQADWELRSVQLEGLRRIYVPQYVFLLHSVYADSGNLGQCLRIADIVADERSRLHATFTHDQMVDLLNKLREVSIDILNQTPDPLGYVDN